MILHESGLRMIALAENDTDPMTACDETLRLCVCDNSG
jgi:hypothetical protein